MTKEDLILQSINEVKDEVKEIKQTMVTKEICGLKCSTQSKRASIITGSIAGIISIAVLIIKGIFYS